MCSAMLIGLFSPSCSTALEVWGVAPVIVFASTNIWFFGRERSILSGSWTLRSAMVVPTATGILFAVAILLQRSQFSYLDAD
jgi:hypothetical protein